MVDGPRVRVRVRAYGRWWLVPGLGLGVWLTVANPGVRVRAYGLWWPLVPGLGLGHIAHGGQGYKMRLFKIPAVSLVQAGRDNGYLESYTYL